MADEGKGISLQNGYKQFYQHDSTTQKVFFQTLTSR